MDRAIENVDIVRAVLMLGQAMGKKVVAEGIETEEQLNTLRMLAVHVGQGYLLGRPIPQHTCLNSFHLLVKIQSCKFQVSLRDR